MFDHVFGQKCFKNRPNTTQDTETVSFQAQLISFSVSWVDKGLFQSICDRVMAKIQKTYKQT